LPHLAIEHSQRHFLELVTHQHLTWGGD
jgi:hypothetical protein